MLKKIGDIVHITPDRRFVVKLSMIPPLGLVTYDYSMKRLGLFYDVIGPVKSPYGLIKVDPKLENPESFIGKSAYVREMDLRRRGGSHGRNK